MGSPLQLARVILDYYRENRAQYAQLNVLLHCRLVRRWRSLYIDCPSRAIAEEAMAVAALVKVPVSQLRLARSLCVRFQGKAIARWPVGDHCPDPTYLNLLNP